MPNNRTSRCPRCGRPSATTTATNDHTFWCSHCSIEFDDQDDGDVGYGTPERHAMRHERQAPRPRIDRPTKPPRQLRGGLGR